MEMIGVVKGLIGAGRWGKAMGVIEEMHALWNTESVSPVTPRPGLILTAPTDA